MANRIIGPNEYKKIAKQNKVSPKNFDQYFMRQGKNILYRDQAVNPTTGTARVAASVAQEAKPQHEIFGNAIMDLLKQYQGIEKYPYAKQGFNAQQEQINRIQASPDQSMAGASPEQQNAVRSASVSAVQPTVSGAQEAGQTFASRLNTFGDILGQARGLQQQMEQSAQQAKADARTLINNAFATTGGSEFLNMNPKELTSLEKTAGLPKDYIHNTVQAIKAREEKLKQEELKSRAPQTMETNKGIFQWNSQTGKWDATGLRGYHPATGGGSSASDRLLTLAEAKENNVPFGTKLSDLLGKIPGAETQSVDQTFEQFVQNEQNKAGQSFTPEKIASLKQQFNATQGSTSELKNAFSFAVSSLPAKNQQSSAKTFDSLVKSGNTSGAAQFVIRTALNGANSDTQSRVLGREGMITSMQKVKQLLNEYQQKGGTNLVVGYKEGAFQAVGKTSNPELATIKNRISIALQEYTRSISGAAFTDNEFKRYESVFPAITKEQPLNSVKVDTLLQIAQEQNDTFYRQALGDTYEKIKPIINQQDLSQNQSSQNQSTIINGKEYQKVQGGWQLIE